MFNLFPGRRVSGKEDIGMELIPIGRGLFRRTFHHFNRGITMKSKKRQAIKASKAEARKRHGKPGAGKSKYALKQKIDNRPGSPIHTSIKFTEELTE